VIAAAQRFRFESDVSASLARGCYRSLGVRLERFTFATGMAASQAPTPLSSAYWLSMGLAIVLPFERRERRPLSQESRHLRPGQVLDARITFFRSRPFGRRSITCVWWMPLLTRPEGIAVNRALLHGHRNQHRRAQGVLREDGNPCVHGALKAEITIHSTFIRGLLAVGFPFTSAAYRRFCMHRSAIIPRGPSEASINATADA